jgi:hypothetical protein
MWTRQFGDNLLIDSSDIKVDTYDNVYIAGRTQNAFGGINYGRSDAYWARFSTSGMMLESQTLGTIGEDSATAIELDNWGNLYITGTTFGELGGTSAGATDVYVAQYSV